MNRSGLDGFVRAIWVRPVRTRWLAEFRRQPDVANPEVAPAGRVGAGEVSQDRALRRHPQGLAGGRTFGRRGLLLARAGAFVVGRFSKGDRTDVSNTQARRRLSPGVA